MTTRIILIIGKRGSGVTTLANEIMNGVEPVIKCMTSFVAMGEIVQEINTCFDGINKSATCDFTYDGLDDAFDAFVKYKKNSQSSQSSQSWVLFDDCIFSRNAWSNKTIQELMNRGQELNTSLIITMSYPLYFPPDVAKLLDFVYVMPVGFNYIQQIYDTHVKPKSNDTSFASFVESYKQECTGYGKYLLIS